MDIKPAARPPRRPVQAQEEAGSPPSLDINNAANMAAPSPVAPKKSKRPLIVIVIGLVLILGALGAAFWLTNKGSSGFIKDARPHAVAPVLGGVSESKAIAKGGGEISLSDEAVSAKLSIMEDSVVSSTEFTVTSLSDVQNLPEGMEFLGGVQVEPDGQTLLNAGWLAIELPDGADTSRLAAFRYHGQGEEFHLYPLAVEDGAAKVSIAGFSGYGILHLNADIAKAPVPTDIGDQAAAAIAAATSKHTADGSLPGEVMTQIKDILKTWHSSEVLPNLKDAAKDDTKARSAIGEWIRWLIFVQLYGLDEDFAEEAVASEQAIRGSLVHAVNVAEQSCRADRDATQIAAMFYWLGAAQLLGMEDAFGGSDAIAAKAEACGKFKLTLKSTLTNPEFESQASATGEGTLGLDMQSLSLTGSGNITEDSTVTLVGKSCTTSQTPEFTFTILPVGISLNASGISLGAGAGSSSLSLGIEFGDTPYIHYKCDYMSLGQPFPEWMSLFMEAHEEREIPGTSGYGFAINDWEIVNQDGVFARKVYQGLHNGVEEDTVFELHHLE